MTFQPSENCKHDDGRFFYDDMCSRYQEIFQCMKCRKVIKRSFDTCSKCGGEGRILASQQEIDPKLYGLGIRADGYIMKQKYIDAWAAIDEWRAKPWWYKLFTCLFRPRKPY